MLKPSTQGTRELFAHMMLDSAANLAIKLSAHSILDESFHDSVVSENPRPNGIPFGGKFYSLVWKILDIILGLHLLQHLNNARLR